MINFDVSQVGDIMLDVMLVNNCSITHIFDILMCAFVLLHIYCVVSFSLYFKKIYFCFNYVHVRRAELCS